MNSFGIIMFLQIYLIFR